jgi:hypothetical protein
MTDILVIRYYDYGRVEKRADEFVSFGTVVNSTSLFQEQDWWTEEWQARHEEAISDLAEGRFTVYETGQDFLAAMDEVIVRNEVRSHQ